MARHNFVTNADVARLLAAFRIGRSLIAVGIQSQAPYAVKRAAIIDDVAVAPIINPQQTQFQ